MHIRKILQPKFIQGLQSLVDQSIWRVTHPADGWLNIDLGKKYVDSIPLLGGKTKRYERGEYQVSVRGDWEVYFRDELVQARAVGKKENQKSYFDRMEKLTRAFPLKGIESITFVDNQIKMTGNDFELRIALREPSDAIGFTQVKLDQASKPVAYSHYRFDEERNSFVYITSQEM